MYKILKQKFTRKKEEAEGTMKYIYANSTGCIRERRKGREERGRRKQEGFI